MNLGPLPLLLLPVLLGGLVFALRRWRWAALVGTAGALLLGIALLVLPWEGTITLFGRAVSLGEPLAVFGRPVALETSDRLTLAYLFLAGAGFFALSSPFEREGLLTPLGLGILGLTTGVLVVQPLIYAVLFLIIGATLAVFPLHAEGRTPARGGLRLLSFYTLALPGLLLSHWLLDMYAVSPDQVSYFYTALGLIAVSFALLLGLFPFHAWVPSVGEDGSPLAAGFLYSVCMGGTWFLLLEYLRTYPWLIQQPEWPTVVSAIGTATVVAGGLLGTTRRAPGALMGYAVMVDTGLAVVALSLGGQRGVGLGLWLLVARALGTGAMAGGLAAIRSSEGGGQDLLPKRMAAAPHATVAMAVGAMSLAGLPPTVGFTARWAFFSSLLSTDPLRGLLLLVASLGPAVGLLRSVLDGVRARSTAAEGVSYEVPAAGVAMLYVITLAILLLGVFPQPLATLAGQIAELLSVFGP